MDNNLQFLETYTVGQFKEVKKISEIRVLLNPKTNKKFIAWTGGTGAVSSKGIPTESPVISLVQTPDNQEFYLLHEEGNGGAETLAVL